MGEDIKQMSGDGIREVRDDGKAVPCIGNFIGGCMDRWGGLRKSKGRVRM